MSSAKTSVARKYPIPEHPVRNKYQECLFVRNLNLLLEINKWWFEYSLFSPRDFPNLCADSAITFTDLLEDLYLRDRNDPDRKRYKFTDLFNWETYVLCIYTVCDIIMAGMPDTQQRRLISSWRSYLDGQQKSKQIIDKRENVDLDEINKAISGMEIIIALIEYSDEIHVPDNEWSDPRIARLRDLCNLSIVYLNDVYSFEKELNEQNGVLEQMLVNTVAYHSLREGITIAAAMRKTLDAKRDIASEFDHLCADVLASDEFSADTKQFVRTLDTMIAGNYRLLVASR
ncbi:unnamed protein product [Medioppia subpectinata]|uniref:Terpene synthase n=1 Tax=Medioppia subpectinata TaxID=1979941 RepID=A0A7R9Q0K8_9ACAR|nr:unnamed protein product [Medioppia subpectinata]CAG2108191.1 unnamed protein product [Medioppia subpectinata]